MGALTIKPLAYKIRSWELTTKEIINYYDNFCSQIVIQKRGEDILRILPSRKEDFFWITDKIRFLYEGLKKQRIEYPYIIYKNKYIKINLEISILFFRYIYNILKYLQEINKGIELLENKKIKIYKNILINNLLSEMDYLSHIFFKYSCLKSNLIKYGNNNYNGNRTRHYYSKVEVEEKLKKKYKIINNISIANNYPRIWLAIKQTKILLLGTNNLLTLNSYNLNIGNNEINLIERFKSVSGLLKSESIIITEKEINEKGINQIVLGWEFNNYLFDYKINFNKVNKEIIGWIFCKDDNIKEEKKGIQISLQTHGIKSNKQGIIFPVTTFFEENSIRLNNKGELCENLGVKIRKREQRSILQVVKLWKEIINEKKEEKLTFNFLKGFLVLKYGNIQEYVKTVKEYIKFPKFKKNKYILKEEKEKEEVLKNTEIIKIKEQIKERKKKNNY